jgi:hypothetical protein
MTKCDTSTLEKITHGWIIAYFSAGCRNNQ